MLLPSIIAVYSLLGVVTTYRLLRELGSIASDAPLVEWPMLALIGTAVVYSWPGIAGMRKLTTGRFL